MKEFKYVITDEIGIHARPAGMIASTAKKFNSNIMLKFGDKETKATKLMALMKLGIKYKDTITVTFDGEDEEEAFMAVSEVIKEIL